MIFQDSSVNISFEPVQNLKRTYFQNEDILNEYFDEPSVLAVPDNAPHEIPRLIFKSKKQHTDLTISAQTISMQTVYTDGFEKDWSRCKDYLLERGKRLFEFANILTSGDYAYIGVAVNVIFDKNDLDGTELISKNLSNLKHSETLYDISSRFTFVEENKYFVNLTIQNVRCFDGDNNPNISGSLSDKNLIKNIVGVTLDINDRYLFNNISGYKSSIDNFEGILNSLSDKISNKLESLVGKGEY